jgi:hypothetical protein
MSRSGYSDDCENLQLWRGAVRSATIGARGQKLLADLLAALDAMPTKRLVAHEFVEDGEFCALGVVGTARGLPVADMNGFMARSVAKRFDIAPALAQEIVYENDEAGYWDETPEARWGRIRQWVASQITATGATHA